MKNLGSVVLVFTLLLFGCAENKKPDENLNYRSVSGEAQGTTYSITFKDSLEITKEQFDSIFAAIDQSLSIWKEGSVISSFNRATEINISDPHFLTVYFRSEEISELTEGRFEQWILPLVKEWGFGPDGANRRGTGNIDSLKALVQKEVELEPVDPPMKDAAFPDIIFRKDSLQKLDVNGIAQGYTVDVIAEFLEKRGISDYMVEVGGEVRANGVNAEGKIWRIGIDKPVSLDEERQLEAVVELEDLALATSGSYRKFYEVDGKRYSHTIDPITGYPVEHGLLSVTVAAANCTNADAFATAFMVMGTEGTKTFIAQNPELKLEVYLIYNEDGDLKTFMSDGMKAIAKEV